MLEAREIITYAFGVLFILIQVLLINYLLRLEKIGCKCAMDWRRKYMLFYMFVLLIHVVLITFVDRQQYQIPILQTAVMVLGVVNVIVTLQYVSQLKKDNCTCSESLYRDIITLVAYLNAIMYSLLFVIVIYFLFSMAYYARNAPPSASSKPKVSVKKLFTGKNKKNMFD